MTTKISWTEQTWNMISGCTQISDGCKNCYAKNMTRRLAAIESTHEIYGAGFGRVVCHDCLLEKPRHWRKPCRVFVCSMADLFHDAVPDSFVVRVLDVIRECPQHTFQLLTKRAARLADFNGLYPGNAWVGVTVESAKYISRIDDLRRVSAPVRYVSFEPLLSAIPAVDLSGVDWAIVGGESGAGARKMELDWAEDLRRQCGSSGTVFFFKQQGGSKKAPGNDLLNGKRYHFYPVGR